MSKLQNKKERVYDLLDENDIIFINDNGYPEFVEKKGQFSSLVHRYLAYNYIYKRNRNKFPLPFSRYDIHHRDKNPLNFNLRNLALVIRKVHDAVHELTNNTLKRVC